MASDLQRLADAVRQLASETGQPMRVLDSIQQELARLSQRAGQFDGAQGADLQQQLASALSDTQAVADAMVQFREGATQFADRLVGTGAAHVGLALGATAIAGAERLSAHTLPGLPAGCLMIPIDLIDQDEDPIHGAQDFGKGYSIEDLEHAFRLLDDQILPQLATGSDAAVFSEHDNVNGLYGTRSLSDTYSGFLDERSGNVIKLELRPDGTYRITNGRHRIFVAAKTGRRFVPAFLFPRSLR